MIKNILLVGFGGFLGSILRYVTYLAIDKRFESTFPLSTFAVNVIGSLLLGLIVGWSLKGTISDPMRLLLAVGLCGSFTTFSTFAMENLNLLTNKELLTSFVYIAASIVVGVGAAFVGQWLVK